MALILLAANNAQTVLAAGISASATSITVNSGTGSLFPTPSAGVSFFKLTLIDAATGQLNEIVHVTARVGDTMTIVRGQEGTTSRAWSANDIAANMLTSGTLGLFAQLESPAFSGAPTAPTAEAGTSTTQIASTAFVAASILAATGRFINTQIFTSSGTYTPSAGTKKIKVYATGGGGGGGGSAATDSTTRSCGGGGGAGSTVISVFNISDITTPVSITIGSGGSAGAGGGSSGGVGGNGGSTLFGSLITAAGGFGGGGGGQATDSGSFVNPNGGGNSASSGGNIVTLKGSAGLPGITCNTGNVSGAGGTSFFSGGGNPASSVISTNGENGTNGSGGSGGMSMKSTSVGKSGGIGGSGLVIIEEFA
ncbi:hypothetical protein [Enterobacter roggenkampii]|uniref:glycine-rich domain-containing protein n=1 Tax=Enterobacter roggenkampii TaxID=1812935 RepID=UPI002FF53772